MKAESKETERRKGLENREAQVSDNRNRQVLVIKSRDEQKKKQKVKKRKKMRKSM